MPARIRLQRKGTKNHPYFMLVASSNKTNFRGVALERLGYWFPERHRFAERSMILNRPRLKYWFGVGAQPTKGALDFLGKTEFLPKRPPPLGTASTYERPKPPPLPLGQHPRTAEIGIRFIKDIDKIEERERMIDEARKEQEEEARIVLNTNPDIDDTKIDLSQSIEQFSNYLESFQKVFPNGTNEQRAALLNYFTSLSADEILEEQDLVKELGITLDQAKKIIKTYESIAVPFTQADLEDFKIVKRANKISHMDREPSFIPLQKTVTPVPEFGNNENDDLAHGLFHVNSELKPHRAYGARIVPKSKIGAPARNFHVLTNPFYLGYPLF